MDVPNIMDSINREALKENFLNVSERYYEHKYCTQFTSGEYNLDQCVGFHTNKVCLISLAENHPVMKFKKRITNVNFKPKSSVNRLKNEMVGKGKRGAQKLETDSVLCYIECSDKTSYPVYSCVKGKLLEINEQLLRDPNILIEKPLSDGFIALILPHLDSFIQIKNSMLTKNEYFSLM